MKQRKYRRKLSRNWQKWMELHNKIILKQVSIGVTDLKLTTQAHNNRFSGILIKPKSFI